MASTVTGPALDLDEADDRLGEEKPGEQSDSRRGERSAGSPGGAGRPERRADDERHDSPYDDGTDRIHEVAAVRQR